MNGKNSDDPEKAGGNPAGFFRLYMPYAVI